MQTGFDPRGGMGGGMLRSPIGQQTGLKMGAWGGADRAPLVDAADAGTNWKTATTEGPQGKFNKFLFGEEGGTGMFGDKGLIGKGGGFDLKGSFGKGIPAVMAGSTIAAMAVQAASGDLKREAGESLEAFNTRRKGTVSKYLDFYFRRANKFRIAPEEMDKAAADFVAQNTKEYVSSGQLSQGGRVGFNKGTLAGETYGWWDPRNKPTPEQQRQWEIERLEREKKAKEDYVEEEVFTEKDIFERDTPLTEGIFGLSEGLTLSPITLLRRYLARKELEKKGDTADEGYTYNKAQGGLMRPGYAIGSPEKQMEAGAPPIIYEGNMDPNQQAGLPSIPGPVQMAEDGPEYDMSERGGFQPLGAQEGKDDVKANLAKNEFVFTADAVRAAGGGSIQQGAQRMYDTMKKLESRVA